MEPPVNAAPALISSTPAIGFCLATFLQDLERHFLMLDHTFIFNYGDSILGSSGEVVEDKKSGVVHLLPDGDNFTHL